MGSKIWLQDKEFLRRFPAGVPVVIDTKRREQVRGRLVRCSDFAVVIDLAGEHRSLHWGRIARARIADQGVRPGDFVVHIDRPDWRGVVTAVADGIATCDTIDGSERVDVTELAEAPPAVRTAPPPRRPGRPYADPAADAIDAEVSARDLE